MELHQVNHHHEGNGLDDSSGPPPSNRPPDDSSSGRSDMPTLAEPATGVRGDLPARRAASANSSDYWELLADNERCDAKCGGASAMRPAEDLSAGLDCGSGGNMIAKGVDESSTLLSPTASCTADSAVLRHVGQSFPTDSLLQKENRNSSKVPDEGILHTASTNNKDQDQDQDQDQTKLQQSSLKQVQILRSRYFCPIEI